MVDLLLRGKLTGETKLLPHGWRTAEGLSMRIVANRVEAEWRDAPDSSPAAFIRLESEVEDRLLLETLASGHVLDVEWTSHRTAHPAGGMSVRRFTVGTWPGRRPPAGLDGWSAERPLLDTHPFLRSALALYREALVLADPHWDAATSVAFLAVELLALELEGDGSRARWARLGLRTGYGSEAALRLYHSIQGARHIDASRAQRWLADRGLAPLSNAGCLLESALLIEATIRHLGEAAPSEST